MAFNLKGMSLKELTKLKDDVEKALKTASNRERNQALKAAEKAAAKFGFSLGELSGAQKPNTKAKNPKKRAKAAAKYRNPANPEQTWSGRGRKPHWIHESLSAGADITDLEV